MSSDYFVTAFPNRFCDQIWKNRPLFKISYENLNNNDFDKNIVNLNIFEVFVSEKIMIGRFHIIPADNSG